MFCRLAVDLAELSTCRRRKVGAVLLDDELTSVLGIGYNGPPCGHPNDGCRPGQEGNCGCVHAEANVLVKRLRPPVDGPLIMVTTSSPCEHCAGLVLNSRQVRFVVYRDEYRDTAPIAKLCEAGVVTVRWEG